MKPLPRDFFARCAGALALLAGVALATVRSMFEAMISAAHGAIASGEDLETAKASFLASAVVAQLRSTLAGEDPVAGKNFDHFVPPGFERAYLEARAELPD